jgi:hypothetical protein
VTAVTAVSFLGWLESMEIGIGHTRHRSAHRRGGAWGIQRGESDPLFFLGQPKAKENEKV